MITFTDAYGREKYIRDSLPLPKKLDDIEFVVNGGRCTLYINGVMVYKKMDAGQVFNIKIDRVE